MTVECREPSTCCLLFLQPWLILPPHKPLQPLPKSRDSLLHPAILRLPRHSAGCVRLENRLLLCSSSSPHFPVVLSSPEVRRLPLSRARDRLSRFKTPGNPGPTSVLYVRPGPARAAQCRPLIGQNPHWPRPLVAGCPTQRARVRRRGALRL